MYSNPWNKTVVGHWTFNLFYKFALSYFRGLLDKNCTSAPDTCLKRKRQLVSKPICSLPTSVTISLRPATSLMSSAFTYKTSNKKQNDKNDDVSACVGASQIVSNVQTSPDSIVSKIEKNHEKVVGTANKQATSLPHTKSRLSSTSSDKHSEEVYVSNGNQVTSGSASASEGKGKKKKCKKKKRKSKKS